MKSLRKILLEIIMESLIPSCKLSMTVYFEELTMFGDIIHFYTKDNNNDVSKVVIWGICI